MDAVTVAADEISSGWIPLAAGVATEVTFEAYVYSVEVRGRGDAAVYFTVDGTEPTIDGRNCYDLMAGAISVDVRPVVPTGVIRLIADGDTHVRIVRS